MNPVERVLFYNLQVSRNPNTVQDEVDALLTTAPLVAVFCEAIGYHLETPGYRQLRRGRRRSRRNIIVAVRRDRRIWARRWLDLEATWGRTQHPGRHEPRSFPYARAWGVKWLGVHQGPQWTDNTMAVQFEGIDRLTNAMRGWRPAVALGDFNRRPGEEGPGPDLLAKRVGGKVVGNRIDCAVVKGLEVVGHQYMTQIDGVPLRSDHRHALLIKVRKPEVTR